MTLNYVIFIDNLRSLDLHGKDRITARIMINDFIKETHETLRKNKLVKAFKTYYYNNGCTIVEINVDK